MTHYCVLVDDITTTSCWKQPRRTCWCVRSDTDGRTSVHGRSCEGGRCGVLGWTTIWRRDLYSEWSLCSYGQHWQCRADTQVR